MIVDGDDRFELIEKNEIDRSSIAIQTNTIPTRIIVKKAPMSMSVPLVLNILMSVLTASRSSDFL